MTVTTSQDTGGRMEGVAESQQRERSKMVFVVVYCLLLFLLFVVFACLFVVCSDDQMGIATVPS